MMDGRGRWYNWVLATTGGETKERRVIGATEHTGNTAARKLEITQGGPRRSPPQRAQRGCALQGRSTVRDPAGRRDAEKEEDNDGGSGRRPGLRDPRVEELTRQRPNPRGRGEEVVVRGSGRGGPPGVDGTAPDVGAGQTQSPADRPRLPRGTGRRDGGGHGC